MTPTPSSPLHGKPLDTAAAQGAAGALAEHLIDQALNATRTGTLAELLRTRPRAARWLMRRWLAVAAGAAGDAFDGAHRLDALAAAMLRWLVTQLRPDLEPGFDGIDREAWLNQVPWRPMLAVACHYLGVAVPEFRDRYRRSSGEAGLENLCGLWGVGPSTFYRYVDRARRQMAQIALEPPASVPRRMALRRFMQADAHQRLGLRDDAGRRAWHARQADRALARRDLASTLWHQLQAGDAAGMVAVLRDHASALAGEPEVDALIERVAVAGLPVRQQFDLCLARAGLARARHATERELAAYEDALRYAHAAQDRLLMGIAYSALGRYHDPRDADRALSCYQDSVTFLSGEILDAGDVQTIEQVLTTMVRLAWLYVARNDPRARAVLDEAECVRARGTVPDGVLGMLEQTWGEYWRQTGDLRAALEHKHRALNIFERLGDRRSVLVTQLNLGLLYGETRDFDRAISYSKGVAKAAEERSVEPAIGVSSHGNLGAIYSWADRLDDAIAHYRLALERAKKSDLRLHANRTHHNLAEAYYKRFRQARNPEDERLGDLHAQAVLSAPLAECSAALVEATRRLKQETLAGEALEHQAPPQGQARDRMIPQEAAVHFESMSEIQRHRATLALALPPEAHVRARLAIANAYLAISTQEREAALQLIRRHGLGDRFASELDQLRDTFDRDLTAEQRLMAQYKQHAADLLDDTRRAALVERLLRDDVINKSGYADLCNVSPATASKHLSMLAERGLLQQTGKGPSTRYRLPA
jgi:tetratricopeptide (TPR) repeat protein